MTSQQSSHFFTADAQFTVYPTIQHSDLACVTINDYPTSSSLYAKPEDLRRLAAAILAAFPRPIVDGLTFPEGARALVAVLGTD